MQDLILQHIDELRTALPKLREMLNEAEQAEPKDRSVNLKILCLRRLIKDIEEA